MSVDAVKENYKSYTPRTSYLGAIGIGAIGGYALKWILPITPQEKDELYKTGISQARKVYWRTRNDEIEAIKKSKKKPEGADEFIKMYEKHKLTYAEIKKLNSPKVQDLFNRINDYAMAAKSESRRKLIINIKGIRPAFTFTLIGAAIGFMVAIINNISANSRELDSEA